MPTIKIARTKAELWEAVGANSLYVTVEGQDANVLVPITHAAAEHLLEQAADSNHLISIEPIDETNPDITQPYLIRPVKLGLGSIIIDGVSRPGRFGSVWNLSDPENPRLTEVSLLPSSQYDDRYV